MENTTSIRYFIHLAYRGSRYRGWQWQPNVQDTIQGVLETTLQKVFKRKITVFGCGRTDAEVHASQYFMHINLQATEAGENVEDWLKKRLNFMLPYDIAIYDIIAVKPNAHSRFDAMERTYHYHIHFHKNPFKQYSSSCYPNHLYDIEKMQEVAQFYATQNDFRAMCKKPNQYQHTRCRIDLCTLHYKPAQDDLLFVVTADRFLQGMIRQLVGRMLDVGRGTLSLEALKECFATGEKPKITTPAYPQGLYLHRIQYPYLNIEPKTIFPVLG